MPGTLVRPPRTGIDARVGRREDRARGPDGAGLRRTHDHRAPVVRSLVDDTGRRVLVPDVVERVASIVPSLTETIAVTAPGLLVAATDWCSPPADLDVVRVKGTKNPDVEAIAGLRPDLVL